MKSSKLTRKTALFALLLALTLFLSACNLVVKDPVVDNAQVVLKVNDEDVSKEEFTKYYNNAYQRAYEQQQMMQQYGYPATPIDEKQLLADTLDSTAKDKLLHQKAHELGLEELSEDELTDLRTQAEAEYNDILGQVKLYYFSGSQLEGEELDQAVEKQANELGLTLDAVLESTTHSNVHVKLLEYAGRDVVVSEEELQTALDEKIAEDQAAYEADLGAYGSALSAGQPIYYTPAGYRYVRQILVSLPQEEQDAINALNSELNPLSTALTSAQAEAERYDGLLDAEGISAEDKEFVDAQADGLDEDKARFEELLAKESLSEEEQKALSELKAKTPVYAALTEATAARDAKLEEIKLLEDQAFATIQEKTDEVMAKALEEGADFDALVSEYSGDPGQPVEGYAVSDATTTFVASFKDAAMALEKLGDISQPVRSNYGYHILKYVSDIKEGPVALDSVRDTLQAELFESKQNEIYQTLETQWVNEAKVEKFPERFTN